MNNVPFKRFIELVSLDQQIKSVEEKKIACTVILSGAEAKRRLFLESLENARKKWRDARQGVTQHEADMHDLDEQERAKKKLLQECSDYKMCQSIKRELDHIQSQQTHHEQLLLQAWSALENAESSVNKMEKEEGELEKEVAAASHEAQQEVDTIDAQLQELLHTRADYLNNDIPQEWLDKYELMGTRVQNPVVPVVQDSCSGCYQQLIMQDLIRLRKSALLQCRRCFRLLYSPESMA